jgi:hypothetical protein
LCPFVWPRCYSRGRDRGPRPGEPYEFAGSNRRHATHFKASCALSPDCLSPRRGPHGPRSLGSHLPASLNSRGRYSCRLDVSIRRCRAPVVMFFCRERRRISSVATDSCARLVCRRAVADIIARDGEPAPVCRATGARAVCAPDRICDRHRRSVARAT